MLIFGCRNNKTVNSDRLSQNEQPRDFEVTVSSISDSIVLLEWRPEIIPDTEEVTYTIFLEDKIVQSGIKNTMHVFRGLTPQTNYSGKIIALNKNREVSENTFAFVTKGERIVTNKADPAVSKQRTKDGGYIVGGSSDGDVVVNKNEVSYKKEIIWEHSYGGTGFDAAQSMQKTKDGGYIIGGFTDSSDGDVGKNTNNTKNHYRGEYNHWLIRLDESGNLLWETKLGNADEQVISVRQTLDEGYIMAGTSSGFGNEMGSNNREMDYWIVKLDTLGKFVWDINLGGSGHEKARSIRQTSDGGYIIAGGSSSSDGDVNSNNGGMDYWIVKLDGNGKLMWETSLGGTKYDIATSVEQTKDGGYIVGGSSNSPDGDVGLNLGGSDYWIVKLDAFGTLEWHEIYGGSKNENVYEIQQTKDGGYIVVGSSESSDGFGLENKGGIDSWVLKLTDYGEIDWYTNLGGSGDDVIQSIYQTKDQEYVLAGYVVSADYDVKISHSSPNTDYWVVKLNTKGTLLWEYSFGGPYGDYAYDIEPATDGGYIIAGCANSGVPMQKEEFVYGGDVGFWWGKADYWIVKIMPK